MTNNAVDFRRLYQHLPVHAGLVIIVPNVAPALQQELLRAALDEIGGEDLINGVLEIGIEDDQIAIIRYDMLGP